jgi:hypothetical protein
LRAKNMFLYIGLTICGNASAYRMTPVSGDLNVRRDGGIASASVHVHAESSRHVGRLC